MGAPRGRSSSGTAVLSLAAAQLLPPHPTRGRGCSSRAVLSLLLLRAARSGSSGLPVMSVGWFDQRADFLGCEPDGGVGLNYSVLSHVTANGCGLSPNNTVCCDCGDSGFLNASTMAALTPRAHAAGTKVVLGLDFTSKACTSGKVSQCPILSPGAAQSSYVASVVDKVKELGLDGVEVDYEAFGAGSADDLLAKPLFSALLVRLKAALSASAAEPGAGHGASVGVCLASYDRNPFIWLDNTTVVIGAVDYINVMSCKPPR